jgi:hypothetical protein
MAKAPATATVNPLAAADPLNLNARLYAQVGKLLDDLEAEDVKNPIGIKERVSVLIAVGRLQTIFVGLRKENFNGATRGSGSAVRKYSTAFAKANAGGRRATGKRAATATANFGRDPFADDADDADDDG